MLSRRLARLFEMQVKSQIQRIHCFVKTWILGENTQEVHKGLRLANMEGLFLRFLGSTVMRFVLGDGLTSVFAVVGLWVDVSRCAIPGTRRLKIHGTL